MRDGRLGGRIGRWCELDEGQNVYPMMLPGKGLSDMVEDGE
jgi:hypothetical protein